MLSSLFLLAAVGWSAAAEAALLDPAEAAWPAAAAAAPAAAAAAAGSMAELRRWRMLLWFSSFFRLTLPDEASGQAGAVAAAFVSELPGAPESELAPELGGVLVEELGRRMVDDLTPLTPPPGWRRLALTRCF